MMEICSVVMSSKSLELVVVPCSSLAKCDSENCGFPSISNGDGFLGLVVRFRLLFVLPENTSPPAMFVEKDMPEMFKADLERLRSESIK